MNPYNYDVPLGWAPDKRARKHRENRKVRLRLAREKGTHTAKEWVDLKKEFYGFCVRCLGESQLMNVEKDHIYPIYAGGSDAIENIQPLCARCNCGKGTETFNWKEYRRWQTSSLGLSTITTHEATTLFSEPRKGSAILVTPRISNYLKSSISTALGINC